MACVCIYVRPLRPPPLPFPTRGRGNIHTLVTIAGLDPAHLRGRVTGSMIIRLLRGLGHTALGVVALAASAAAQGAPNQPASNPACVRLESQLAAINRGSTDPTRADQVKRAEDAVAKQQADLDRTLAQAHKQGCEGQGFLSLFSSLVPQCGPINSQIQQMRGNLDRATTDLEQLKSGTGSQDSQRRALIGQLAQNNCGAQYTAAANEAGPRASSTGCSAAAVARAAAPFSIPAATARRPAPSARSACAPATATISRSRTRRCRAASPTTSARASGCAPRPRSRSTATAIRARTWSRRCRSSGQPYTALPNAFRYRKEFTPACSCRKPGQSWADALKDADDRTTLQGGDIVVTDQTRQRRCRRRRSAKPVKGAPAPPAASTGRRHGDSRDNARAAAGIRAAGERHRSGASASRAHVGPPFVSRLD